jgi:DNA invertase Pin-like site-specific DNA recombinase
MGALRALQADVGSKLACKENHRHVRAGRALFQMAGVFAEFERSLIQERVRAGLRRAKRHGTKSCKPIGRPRVTVETEVNIRRLRRQGYSYRAIAAELRCGHAVVQRVLRT